MTPRQHRLETLEVRLASGGDASEVKLAEGSEKIGFVSDRRGRYIEHWVSKETRWWRCPGSRKRDPDWKSWIRRVLEFFFG